MKLTEKEKSILRALAAGDFIKADWKAKSSRGGFFLAKSSESIHKRTLKSLHDKGLIDGAWITKLGKQEIKNL